MARYAVKTELLDGGLTAIADALRTQTGSTELLSFPDGMAAEVDAVYEAGKKTVYDTFWDTFQNGGSEDGVAYNYAFAYGKFTDENYAPKYPIIVTQGNTTFDYAFCEAKEITDIKVPVYNYANRTQHSFYNCSALKTIPLLHLLETSNYGNTFNGCSSLENLTISGIIGNTVNLKWSPLTKASIESVVNALSDAVSDMTLTLSLTAANTAFETGEGTADGSTSEEWLALAATKTNWTISLV